MITPPSRLYHLRTLIASSTLACAFGFLLSIAIKEPVAREQNENQHLSEQTSSASAASDVRNAFRRVSGYGSSPPGEGVSVPQGQQGRNVEQVQNVITAAKDAQFASDSAKRAAEYLPELERLGLSRDQAASVLSHLDDLHRGAINAGDSTLELLQERERYDTNMKAMLGEKAYGEYKAFEKSRPFRRELTDIQSFAAERGIRLSQTVEAQLPDLLRGVELFTSETWSGPYDHAPRPAVGEGALAIAVEYTERVKTGFPKLITALASDQTVSESDLTILRDYYQERWRTFEEVQRVVALTPEERAAEDEAFVRSLRERRAP